LEGGGGSQEENAGERVVEKSKRGIILNMNVSEMEVRNYGVNRCSEGSQRDIRVTGGITEARGRRGR
jgi:hypothetical protein